MTRRHKRTLIRILAAAVLTVAAAVLHRCGVISGLAAPFDTILLYVLYLIPYGIVGYDVIIGAVKNLFSGRLLDERFLMMIATVGAFALGENLEAVAVMLLYQIGELFQSIAVGKSRRNIASLMDIRPDTASVLRDGAYVTVSPEEVAVGELFRVLPGEKIPLDGCIVEGESAMNTAALTGESLPQPVGVGSKVVSGAVNLQGVITVRAESEYQNSTVARVLNLVENASERKAHIEGFITRFAHWYTPSVVVGAILLAFIPPIFVGDITEWIGRALVFLVVSCPCALVISVPLSFFGGIGGASRRGILIKGAEYIEVLSHLDTMVFDKTGTLTRGEFCVAGMYPENGEEKELLSLAAAVERNSRHPLAAAVVAAVKDDAVWPAENVQEYAGEGIAAMVNGREVAVGNDKLMRRFGVTFRTPEAGIGTLLYVAADGTFLGALCLADEIKPECKAALADLKKCGVRRTVMLTGDRRAIGEAVGREIGVDETHCELLPDDKVGEVEKLLENRPSLAFVGDGINDAPVLSRADVGIAMGALGSDAAIEAADVVLMDDRLDRLPETVRLSRRTMRIVRENIGFALGVKAAVLILSALGFADMWIALFADVGVMVLAILNAMRAMSARQLR